MKKSEYSIYLLLVVLFLVFTMGPIAWAFIMSITPEPEIIKNSSQVLTENPTFRNYQELFDPNNSTFKTVFTSLFSTIKMSLLSIVIGLPVATLAAYAFYRYEFKGKKLLFIFIIITMVIPIFTTIIPIYAMFARNRWLDNMFAVAIIYVSAFLPLTIWIIYSFFRTIPIEVIEAAMMDGAKEVRIFIDVVMPISKNILVTGILILFLMSWSQFQIPMILTTSQETKVITLVMQEFQGRYTIEYGQIAAIGLVAILPPVIVAIFFRRFLISGLMGGSTKG